MMDDYWRALLKGLTPDRKEDLKWWWLLPLLAVPIFVAIKILSQA
tara:strand:- start:848 stop:982 length:135 start_codon:yes stop_codon:yes gene_type:complete